MLPTKNDEPSSYAEPLKRDQIHPVEHLGGRGRLEDDVVRAGLDVFDDVRAQASL